MPERKVIVCFLPGAFDQLNQALQDGWRLDKNVHSGVVLLEYCIVYHLIKYSAEDLEALQRKQEEKRNFSLKALSLISVPLVDVDAKLKEGYEIIPDKIYAKEAVLVKWKKPEGA